jgi:predicted patatin/cPLA2 family phospholipase
LKKGLILEGGAMRGLFTAGICDVMMEHNVWPDGLIGVSAGAAFGCNYKSRQPGRAIRYNMRFAHDRRYSGLWSLLTTGNYFNAHFAYHVVPHEYDLFDNQAFDANPMEFILVCTDVETGQPVYKRLERADEQSYDWIRASASMPLAARAVELDGHKLLDGGVSDSIPLAYAEQQGYDRNVVILTQPQGYVKHITRLMPLMRIALRHYPRMVEAMQKRPDMYNAQTAYVAQAEHEGRCLVIRPDEPIPIGHISHDPSAMKRVYQIGRSVGERHIDHIISYYSN